MLALDGPRPVAIRPAEVLAAIRYVPWRRLLLRR